MANTKLPKRPAGSVFKWSRDQGVDWIRKSVRAGKVDFSDHAFQRSAERFVTHEQAIDCVLKGFPSEWENGVDPQGDPDRRINFKQQLRTKNVKVVTVVTDKNEVVIIATVISPKY